MRITERLNEPGLAQEGMARMVRLIDGCGGWSWNGNVTFDMLPIQARWKEFIDAHRAEILAGKTFPAEKKGTLQDGPVIREEMIPPNMNVTVKDFPGGWPKRP